MMAATLTQAKTIMWSWAIALLAIAIVAGVLGLGGIVAGAAGVAKILFSLS